jgi:hypothetical protein
MKNPKGRNNSIMELFSHVRLGAMNGFDCAKITINKDKNLGECMISLGQLFPEKML